MSEPVESPELIAIAELKDLVQTLIGESRSTRETAQLAADRAEACDKSLLMLQADVNNQIAGMRTNVDSNLVSLRAFVKSEMSGMRVFVVDRWNDAFSRIRTIIEDQDRHGRRLRALEAKSVTELAADELGRRASKS